MSITSNFPAIKPTLLLDFANTKQLDPRITFTRASTATYYGTQTAKAEENLLLQSQTFENASWSVADNVSITANTATAPDSTVTADTLAETAVTGIHTCSQNSSSTGVLTLSVFAKPNSGTPFLTIGISSSGTSHSSATFDLSLGTNTQTQVNGGFYASPSATITAVAQGFYRCTFTVTTTDNATLFRIGLNNTGTPTSANRSFGATYLGVVTNSIFVWGAQLEQRSAVTAYTPTTTQTITNYIPVLETAASGVARFDHNPTTFESLGLEIEESRTNLVTYSEQFDDASWSKVRSSIVANTVVAPSGALTGDKLVEDTTASNSHFVEETNINFTAAPFTWTVYLKAAERMWARLILLDGVATHGTYFDLSTGALGTSSAGVIAVITSAGNGWYRCSITVTPAATASGNLRISLATGNNSASYTGDGYSGIYIWGAQLEAGAFPTSYIPTVASQVTRAADAASMTGTNFSSWFNQAEGSLYVDYNLGLDNSSIDVCMFDDATSNNNIQMRYASGSQAQYTVNVGGVSQVSLAPSGYSATGNYKRAVTYATNSFNQAINGVLPNAEDTSGVVPIVTNLRIGTGFTGNSLNSTIKKIAYYPLRVTNAQLQALTS